MSDQQPELRWAPLPPQPKRRGRVWVIVGLSVLAVALVAALLFFLFPRGSEAPSPTPSATTSVSPSPSASPTPTSVPTPSQTPLVTAPPVADPDLGTFRSLTQPRLDDAVTGLGFLPDMSGPDAAQVVDQLQQDAEVFASNVAPSSIAEDWSAAVGDYAQKLSALRGAYDSGSSATEALNAASSALQTMRSLVGL